MTVQTNKGPETPGTWTIGSILNWTRQYFDSKGVENSRLDAEVLLSHVLETDRLYLYVHFDQPLEGRELAAYRENVRRRAARQPVAYITGHREFMGLEFSVSASVLIPRPDTEILVEAAQERLGVVAAPRLADLGTGSGAIIVSLLHRLPAARGIAVDISPEALNVAAANGQRHELGERLECRLGDLFIPLAGEKFDAILSNPPYIPDGHLAQLAPEVHQEPRLALAGGTDGLDFYRRLVAESDNYLNPGGFLALEVGIDQAAAVVALADPQRLAAEAVIKDYAGIERVIIFRAVKEG
ncbi:MAG TPA: peptide chain release factor N(5)-glutamine methyltransferase [Patescibacteria group bacterium]|nr:peptide chain release factor N(5)-glutamine methyltransferase [Patescibacteria group bacterium]